MNELIDAAKAGDVPRVREILQRSPSSGAGRAEGGESAVMAALYNGHRDLANEIAEAQIAAGHSLDVFAAAALGRSDELERALADGGAITAYSYDGWTALHLAAFFGQLEAAARLLEAGARLAAVSQNPLRNTPLHAAVAGGHADRRCSWSPAARTWTRPMPAATRRCTSRLRTGSCR
jgi:ankyrin repeat protein